jgi:2-methylcitrate dehydratase PrpD
VKPYAACRYCHPAIDAVLKMRVDHSLRPERIASVNVATYALAVAKHDHTVINGISSAKMSIPYSVAVALVTGKAGIQEYSDECISNPVVADLAKKVGVRPDADLTALFPKYSAAVVEVATLDGKRFIERIDSPKGEAAFPLSDREIEEKCAALAVYGRKSKDESQQIVHMVWDLEKALPNLFLLL